MFTITKERFKKAHTQKRDDLRRQTCTADSYDTINIMYTSGCKFHSPQEGSRMEENDDGEILHKPVVCVQ